MSTVVVTGGREYRDKAALWAVLDAVAPTLLVHGGGRGADTLAGEWAQARGVPCICELPNWKQGLLGGFWRNIRMLDKYRPNLVVAAPGEGGTMHCVRHAHLRNIPVKWVNSLP